ncbi:MAG: cell division protein FtsQ/DivIB [Candidatus Uhrbacteria bacterium]|nr:cell division protein FtsQ/DivIB [Candidatus Uhrbacteria bacterium]
MQKRNHFHRLQQKRYSRGAYRNPYFQAPKTSIVKYVYAFVGGVIAFFAIMIYFYAYPAFSITNVEIRGLDPLSNAEMETHVHEYLGQSHVLFFHNTNRFLFSEKKFREYISKTFAFDQLDLKLKKQTLQLIIKERTSDVIWKTGSETYLADLQGVITQKIDAQAPVRTLPILTDRDNKPVLIGDHVLSEDQIKHIIAFESILSAQGFGFREAQIDLQAGKWMGIVTLQGYVILFDPDADLQAQFDRLKAILHDTIKDTAQLQYIDLRFGDHVYYK